MAFVASFSRPSSSSHHFSSRPRRPPNKCTALHAIYQRAAAQSDCTGNDEGFLADHKAFQLTTAAGVFALPPSLAASPIELARDILGLQLPAHARRRALRLFVVVPSYRATRWGSELHVLRYLFGHLHSPHHARTRCPGKRSCRTRQLSNLIKTLTLALSLTLIPTLTLFDLLIHSLKSSHSLLQRCICSIVDAYPAIARNNIANMAGYTRKQIVTFISIIYLVFATAMAG